MVSGGGAGVSKFFYYESKNFFFGGEGRGEREGGRVSECFFLQRIRI